MGRKNQNTDPAGTDRGRFDWDNDEKYEAMLRRLQIELVKVQRHIIGTGQKVLVILEGRDAAGKDGTIKRITEHMSPRETRVVALPKPSDRDRTCWYFQRYVEHLPAAGEFVIFNRSWYNRAGVERVLGFCSDDDYEDFMHSVVPFEQMLVNSGIRLLKYYLDIEKQEQIERLRERATDPLKQWKISPIDAVATEKWKPYSKARDTMLLRTHNAMTPWHIVHADDKPTARINVFMHLLGKLHYPDIDKTLSRHDPDIVFEFEAGQLEDGRIAR
jgi:polyphosphate kinase 2